MENILIREDIIIIKYKVGFSKINNSLGGNIC